jgi:hypothetical protein
MRFMMSLPARAELLEKAVAAPNKELVAAMHKFNEEMAKAGVLLAAEGPHATSKGSRIRVSGGKRIIEIRQIFEMADFPPELQRKSAQRSSVLFNQIS